VRYLIRINSFPLSAIKNSHKKTVSTPAMRFNSQFKLSLYIKGFLLLGKWRDDYQFLRGTPHAKLFVTQGLHHMHLHARMGNYQSELSFVLHSPTSF